LKGDRGDIYWTAREIIQPRRILLGIDPAGIRSALAAGLPYMRTNRKQPEYARFIPSELRISTLARAAEHKTERYLRE
jgi:hypothetical protein